MSDTGGNRADELLEERLRQGLERLADAATAMPARVRHPAFKGAFDRAGSRYRRWWWLPMLPALSALGAGAVIAASLLFPVAPARVTPPYHPPYAPSDLAADLPGELAYVSAGELYSAEPGSAPGRVSSVVDPSSSPEWSPDGQWIAYLGPRRGLHVVSVDGLQVPTGLGGAVVAMTWSPTSDVLAALVVSGPYEGRLVLLSMTGSTTGALAPTRPVTVASRAPVVSFAWSPGGQRMAVTTAPVGPSGRAGIEVIDLAGGPVTILPYVAPAQSSLILGGWWPDGKGLLAWNDPGESPTSEAAGLDLLSIPLGASQAMLLDRTLVYLPWLAWSPGGNRLLLVHSSGALPWAGTGLALCRPAQGTCHDLPEPPGTVQLDPAWSPDGRTIAFVQAAAESGLAPGVGLDAWFESRSLWVESAAGTNPRRLAGAGTGVAEPRFSPGGSQIAFVTSSSIETVPISGAHANVLVGNLSGALSTAGPDGYGKLPWGGLAIWGA